MLRPKKHITKQKIKEDQFVIRTMQTADWLKEHQNSLIIAAVVLAVGIFAFMGWRSSRAAAEEAASVLALQGGYSLQAGDSEGARPVLLRAVNRYPGTRAAGRAAFMLGQLYFQSGEVDSARTYYERVLRKYASDDLTRSGARAGLAACAEEAEQYEEAGRLYEQAANEGAEVGLEAGYLLDAGRSWQLAGRTERAAAVYQRVKDSYPGDWEADRAAIEMAALAYDGG